MLVRTEVAKQAEQLQIGEGWHVGRRVLAPDDVYNELNLEEVRHEVFDNDVWVDCVLFQLDDDGGLIFVDPSILRPYPSEKIEEPKK